MSSPMIAFRTTEEGKDAIQKVADSHGRTLSNIMGILGEQVARGDFTFDGEKFVAKEAEKAPEMVKEAVSEPQTENKSLNVGGVDFTEFFDLAKKNCVTPESFLRKVLMPFRK